MARTPLIETAPVAPSPDNGRAVASDILGSEPWLRPAGLTIAERLAIVSVVMQYGSERDREQPIPAAQRIAEGIVGDGWPNADGSSQAPTT